MCVTAAARSQRGLNANGYLAQQNVSPKMITAKAGRERRRSSLAAANMAANLLLTPSPVHFSPKLANLAENEDLEEEEEDHEEPKFEIVATSLEPVIISHGTTPPDPEDSEHVTPARRRAVTTSDLRSCALVQTRMKNWKTYPE